MTTFYSPVLLACLAGVPRHGKGCQLIGLLELTQNDFSIVSSSHRTARITCVAHVDSDLILGGGMQHHARV